jgi:hypothetical protein
MTTFQRISKYVALLTLAAILAVSCLFLWGKIEPAPMKTWMLILTAVWYAAAAVWMRERSS